MITKRHYREAKRRLLAEKDEETRRDVALFLADWFQADFPSFNRKEFLSSLDFPYHWMTGLLSK